MARFTADWPHLTGSATSVPILDVYGTEDDTITPDLATCVFERLTADKTNFTTCIVPGASHSSTLGQVGDYVGDWIASITLGEKMPDSVCSKQVLVDTMGKPVTCNPLLPTN
jgi:hypothetical protein